MAESSAPMMMAGGCELMKDEQELSKILPILGTKAQDTDYILLEVIPIFGLLVFSWSGWRPACYGGL